MMEKETKFKQTEIGMIPEDWEIELAEKYCGRVTDGTHDSPKKKESGKYLITSRHLKNNSLDFENAYFISEDDFEEINRRSKVDQYDIIFSMIGTVGEIYLEKNKEICYAIKNVGLFKFKGDKDKALWFYFYVKSPLGQEYIETRKAGSTQQYLTLDTLRNFPIAYPLSDQDRNQIIKILSDLDDKIELNQQMNKTLEAICQAIFNHWFVDFEFPNEEGKPYKSSGGEMVYNEELGKEIPKGWELGTLSDLIEEKRIKINNREAQVLSAIKTGELMRSEDFFTKKVYSKNISKYLEVNKFDFAYNPARINIGSIGLLKKDILGAVSPVYVVFSCKNRSHYFIEQMLKQPSIKTQIIQFCSGTVRQTLDFEGFKRIKLLIPSKDLFIKYNDFYEKLLSHQESITKEVDTLSQICNSLLPKLMSGKIRVPLEEKDND